MEKSLYIAGLIVKKQEGHITSTEELELKNWISEDPENERIFSEATDPVKQLDRLGVYAMFNKDKVYSALEQELFQGRQISIFSRRMLRYAAAILLPVLTAGAFAWYFLSPVSSPYAQIDRNTQPGTELGVLILSDGTSVELENTSDGENIFDGETVIENQENCLQYTSEERNINIKRKARFNELRTPLGGSYSVKLADGTRAWLNAGSSLRFPVEFRDSIRKVFLEGEAYFEVSHSEVPFIVSTKYTNTRVLGTTFNVTAYNDDPEVTTTLANGRVQVEILEQDKSKQKGYILSPDEQLVFEKNTVKIRKLSVDASGYTSWINGKVEFHNENMEVVMRKLARWYDFEYQFVDEEVRKYHFSARLDRDAELSTILEMLEMTTKVQFEYKKGVIIIK